MMASEHSRVICNHSSKKRETHMLFTLKPGKARAFTHNLKYRAGNGHKRRILQFQLGWLRCTKKDSTLHTCSSHLLDAHSVCRELKNTTI